jgi:biotin transporter BioY
MGYLYSICLKLFVQVSIPVRSESGPDILVLIRDSLGYYLSFPLAMGRASWFVQAEQPTFYRTDNMGAPSTHKCTIVYSLPVYEHVRDVGPVVSRDSKLRLSNP